MMEKTDSKTLDRQVGRLADRYRRARTADDRAGVSAALALLALLRGDGTVQTGPGMSKARQLLHDLAPDG